VEGVSTRNNKKLRTKNWKNSYQIIASKINKLHNAAATNRFKKQKTPLNA
jgi:hypothetical protein